ncbi:reverse transcriptase [compost metagenome]
MQVAEIIERNRIKKSKNIIFSYRFLPNEKGDLYDSAYNYTAFKTYVKQQAKNENVKVVVTTDIANFYDRINLHRVESVLLSLRGIEKKQVHLINEILLFWANRDSYGLPVGSNASRILAEAALIEVDNYLISKKINFCRFVDDYRIFAPDAATAHHWLAILVERLNKEGLFLNSNKTNLFDVSAETAEKKVYISKIIRGYSGLIPTKFRALSESEKFSLSLNKIEILRKNVIESVLIEPIDFVKYVKTIIAQESFNDLVLLTNNLNKFPQFFPYTLDVISKFHASFSTSQISEIKNNLKVWLDRKETSEFILVYLVRFFGNEHFRDKEVLMTFFET